MNLVQKFLSGLSLLLLLCILLAAGMIGIADHLIPKTVSVFWEETGDTDGWLTLSLEEEEGNTARGTLSLFGVLPLKEIELRRYQRLMLVPGGQLFGLRAPLNGILVTALTEVAGDAVTACPAKEAGLACGDLITAVDGVAVRTAEEFSDVIAASGGRALSLTVLRKGASLTLAVSPLYAAKERCYRVGITVKDSIAGIGTVTFIDPGTGAFGGLGHGVYDGIGTAPAALARGTVTGVSLSGVRAGAPGVPGELRGHLTAERLGTLLSNTDCGVFGILASPPAASEAIPIALRHEVVCGPAEILCTVEGEEKATYSIEITSLRGEKNSQKSFSIRVTDPRLLETTGGIVQGMSGSPIIQNGKLVGAVTHVMIGDPTAGYGIFIENMLSAAEMPMQRAA